jgi:hypothetical protein
MILGRFEHPSSACFDEIDFAIRQMTDRTVCFNAHLFEPPPGAIVFNTEDVMCATQDGSYVEQDPAKAWAGHEVWDCFASNAAKYGATYVPVGYHPSMERFGRASCLDIDVFFCGVLNPRRKTILEALAEKGLRVVYYPRVYGRSRDDLLSRAKLSLQMQYNPHGQWNTLRTAHCVANGVPIVSETHEGAWPFIEHREYAALVDFVFDLVKGPPERLAAMAERSLAEFRKMPMELPS